MLDTVGVLVCTLLPTVLTAMAASTFADCLRVLIAPKLQCFSNWQANVFQEKSVYYLSIAEKTTTEQVRK